MFVSVICKSCDGILSFDFSVVFLPLHVDATYLSFLLCLSLAPCFSHSDTKSIVYFAYLSFY